MSIAIDLYSDSCDVAVITPLDVIFREYAKEKQAIEKIASFVSNNDGAMHYFFRGAQVKGNSGAYTAGGLFKESNAVDALNADYWSRVMGMTDVLESMPAKSRNEWNKQIHDHQTPDFDRDTVHTTMNDLLMNRAKFFADRVDGLFNALSGNHVTNEPQGFGKRMIVERMMTYYQTVNHETSNYVHDLRVVIGKFSGREVPNSRITDYDISRIYDSCEYGRWHTFDGGAWKLKLFKKGTAHMEVHPEMAWRLNRVLASIYPAAIPANFRKKPKRIKEHQLDTDILPFKVINELGAHRFWSESCISFDTACLSAKTKEVLEYIGGESVHTTSWEFSYPVKNVLFEVIRSGQLPEKKTHQFFQTNENLAMTVVDMADIEDDHEVLEPSAGLGAIAMFLPKDRTTCVEISGLHCRALESKGFHTYNRNFISWDSDKKFDRIVMNPPFSDGRALEHLTKAHSLLKKDGKLTAILPASMKDKTFFDDFKHEWSGVLTNEFKESGTGVSVSILKLTH